MEKTISPEERIKRAEEIYYRRRSRNNDVRMPSSQVTEKPENRQLSLYKKMALQILICIVIYLIFSLIKDANYLFSEDILNKTKEFLSTDINFEKVSSQVSQFFKDNQEKFGIVENWLNDETGENQQNEEEQDNKKQDQNQQNEEEGIAEENQEQSVAEERKEQNQENSSTENQGEQSNQEAGIGGSSDNEETIEASSGGASTKTQMEIDAEYIKENFSMVLPAKAIITSHYGKREPTQIVSANHQGIDIGVVVGTEIVASMDGKVTTVSTQGDYGTHVKIVNKDVTTIYAHCSKILVKEGDTIEKGQKIALSGNTGNTTGPHLHFEIRRENRTVDPELILSWK